MAEIYSLKQFTGYQSTALRGRYLIPTRLVGTPSCPLSNGWITYYCC